MRSDLPINTMKLYSQVERIYNELREFGYEDDAPVDVEALFAYDPVPLARHRCGR